MHGSAVLEQVVLVFLVFQYRCISAGLLARKAWLALEISSLACCGLRPGASSIFYEDLGYQVAKGLVVMTFLVSWRVGAASKYSGSCVQ